MAQVQNFVHGRPHDSSLLRGRARAIYVRPIGIQISRICYQRRNKKGRGRSSITQQMFTRESRRLGAGILPKDPASTSHTTGVACMVTAFFLGVIVGLVIAAAWDIYFQSGIDAEKRKHN